MTEGIESVGEAVTGGMIARAVEPKAGEAVHEASHGACLNCGTAMVGDYCHACGQSGHIHRTLTAWWHDLAHGVLHLDGKIWRTLPLLAWRPGELTRRYIEGERAKFVSPMALFLFSVFLMFAVFSAIGGPVAFDGQNIDGPNASREFEAEKAATEKKLQELKTESEQLRAAGDNSAAVDQRIEDLESELSVLSAAEGIVGGGDGVLEGLEAEADKVNVDTGSPSFDAAVEKAARNPSLLLYKVETNAYKFSWLLIPLSVPFLWLLLFWKRRYRVYDHTVFITYSLAFMTLGLVALSLLRPLGLPGAAAVLAIVFVPPIHMYRQLRGSYALSGFGALWRTVFLLVFATMAATFFALLLLALGALA